MDHSHAPWGDEEERASGQRDLNFGGTMVGQCDDEGDEGYRRRVSRDPMSHRIIEKRRRDRMNSCLADLSRLIPAEYLKRGRGRIEKTEIIEMAIRHMRHLQEQSQQPFLSLSHQTPPLTTSSSSSSPGSCSSSPAIAPISSHQDVCEIADECNGSMARMSHSTRKESSMSEQYQLGFFECLSEALHFLIEVEGFPAGGALCLSLDTHLRDHCASLLQGSPLSSSKTECSVEEESHYQIEMSQKKSLSHSNPDIPAASSEGEDLEPVIQVPDCQNSEVEQPRELRVMLTRNEQEMHRGEGASILTLPGDSGASYKFKSNIKRRFTAGLEKRRKFEESEARKCEEADNGITTITSLPPHAPHSSNSAHLSPQYNQMPNSAQQQSEHTSPPRVPVFALHSEQSFYVPLMLDMDALMPHASLLSKSASALHPVTISVNFCNSGGVDECSNVDRHSGIPLTTSRDFPCAMESSVIMDSQSKHNCRHWRPAESYISQ